MSYVESTLGSGNSKRNREKDIPLTTVESLIKVPHVPLYYLKELHDDGNDDQLFRHSFLW